VDDELRLVLIVRLVIVVRLVVGSELGAAVEGVLVRPVVFFQLRRQSFGDGGGFAFFVSLRSLGHLF
jgi:hypothetical protein